VPVGTLVLQPENRITANSYGGEVALTIAATDDWRLTASYSLLILHAHGETAADFQPLALNAPTHQAVLRSSYDFTKHASLDAQLRYVDNVQAVAAYVTVVLGLGIAAQVAPVAASRYCGPRNG